MTTMRAMINKWIVRILLLTGPVTWSQQVLDLDAFLGYVKAYHPYLKQADIKLSESQVKLLKSRGAFDPKFGFDQKTKTFKGTSYYDKQNASISIPTYFGLAIQAGVQQAEGDFLNPENQLSGDRLYGVGAFLQLGRGLLANPRQTALKQAKLFTQQAREKNALQVNAILIDAAAAYLDWFKAYRIFTLYDQFVTNAAFRFEGVKKRMLAGDLAVIDTVEARIAFNQRLLSQENARLDLRRKALKASDYLWVDGQAVVIQDSVEPFVAQQQFEEKLIVPSDTFDQHPQLQLLSYKRQQLLLEKRLQRNNLLPEVQFHYQWLSETDPSSSWAIAVDPDNQTTGLKISLPLFLRKERANLKLATLAVEDVDWKTAQIRVQLQNGIQALWEQKIQLARQWAIAQNMVADYQLLFEGEKRKFEAGESSLFLVNTRESKLIEALLKSITLEVAWQKAKLRYYYAVNFPSLMTT